VHLGRVAAELLPEGDGHRVHQMRAARLDDVVELDRLGLEGIGESLQRRQQIVDELVESGKVHRRRKDIVRGLPHVHVVVRVHVFARE
jgi:hypothetical protein